MKIYVNFPSLPSIKKGNNSKLKSDNVKEKQ